MIRGLDGGRFLASRQSGGEKSVDGRIMRSKDEDLKSGKDGGGVMRSDRKDVGQ